MGRKVWPAAHLDVHFINTLPVVKVGATLVVARGWAGTRPAPTGAGLTKWTSSYPAVPEMSFENVVEQVLSTRPSPTFVPINEERHRATLA